MKRLPGLVPPLAEIDVSLVIAVVGFLVMLAVVLLAKQQQVRHGDPDDTPPGSLPDDPWGLGPGVTPKGLGGAIFRIFVQMFRRR